MQPIDPNKLFDIFHVSDEAVYKEHGIEKALNSPFVLLGSVIRGIENYHLMDVMYSKHYPKEYKRNKVNITIRYFSKLYSYLTKIKVEPIEVVKELEQGFDTIQIVNALDFMRKFFEKIEHYEKCALVKKYIDSAKLIKETS